jgi:hypothetical protein
LAWPANRVICARQVATHEARILAWGLGRTISSSCLAVGPRLMPRAYALSARQLSTTFFIPSSWLFFDCVWLYCFALLGACGGTIRLQLTDVEGSLKRQIFGGESGIREREALMKGLKMLKEKLEGAGPARTADGLFDLTPGRSVL